jgi:hypothetical protein
MIQIMELAFFHNFLLYHFFALLGFVTQRMLLVAYRPFGGGPCSSGLLRSLCWYLFIGIWGQPSGVDGSLLFWVVIQLMLVFVYRHLGAA